jgi:hypothetical protein
LRATPARALAFVREEDRDYVSLFLEIDLQAAYADADLGNHTAALQRIDALLTRYQPSGHPLALGLLHEARARISLDSGDVDAYRSHLARMEQLLRPTRTAPLIAKCEQVAALLPPAQRLPSSELCLDVSPTTSPQGETVRTRRAVSRKV